LQAIVLAGGLGTRLRSVVPDLPKRMASINGEPFLAILIRYLAKKGIGDLFLAVGYKSEVISNYFHNNFEGVQIHYVHEKNLLGTGGALQLALRQISEQEVLVLNGDSFLEFDLDVLYAINRPAGAPVIFVREVNDVSRYGAIKIANSELKSFGEKNCSGPGLINGGVYLLPRDIFADKDLETPFSLEEFLEHDVQNRTYLGILARGIFIDIGTPDDYNRAQDLLGGGFD
jgi:D-glycero-alpha-D-manno-heptose 1-phosphate guanylyltransferase